MIEACHSVECPGWLQLRFLLWPQDSADEHLAEMAIFVAEPNRFAQFIAYDEANKPLGFVEAALRSDYVNGTNSSPVAFLEGVYVLPEARRRGIAHALVGAVEIWARNRACTEFASDASTDNPESHRFHQSLGFKETERVVYFRKMLAPE
uniref:aminoglycoside N-acetyltransferase AAC(6')-Id n=1 Tax=Klebsiella pneumoniae TaxID=573 RepID=UPI000A1767CE|nr:aminoglycoside N-acetyltransferase AAC(6')-Id [Klebsiella pneumoniae]